MPNIADIGIGSTVQIGVGATPTWTTLDKIQTITLPQITTEQIEVTHMGSTGRMKEFIGGMKDGGEVTLDMLWIPANATDVLLTTLLDSSDNVQIKFTIPGGGSTGTPFVTVWNCFVSGYERSVPTDDVKTATATFKISSKIS